MHPSCHFILKYCLHTYFIIYVNDKVIIIGLFFHVSNTELSKYKKILRTIKQHPYVYIIIINIYIYKEILILIPKSILSALNILWLISFFFISSIYSMIVEEKWFYKSYNVLILILNRITPRINKPYQYLQFWPSAHGHTQYCGNKIMYIT